MQPPLKPFLITRSSSAAPAPGSCRGIAASPNSRPFAAAAYLSPLADARNWLDIALTQPDGPARTDAVAHVVASLNAIEITPDRIGLPMLGPGSRARLEAVLGPIEPQRREQAAAELCDAYESFPLAPRLLEDAAWQLSLAARQGEPTARQPRLEEAARIADRLVAVRDDVIRIIESIATDPLAASDMPAVPRPVLVGFLKQLRTRL